MNDDAFDIVLTTNDLSHWFGSNKVLYNVNIRIARGQIIGLVGPSGCGKSTLLRAVLGTHPPCSGAVRMNEQVVTTPGRDRGIVYQRYSLYPFLNARDNVAFGLMLDQTTLLDRSLKFFKYRKLREQHRAEADAWLKKVGLGHAADRFPHELSGGMRQRVAFAAAKIMKPKVLLLDEPFGALDEATREDLQQLLLERYKENLDDHRAGRPPQHTILIVTHELNEAILVGDRIIGLSQYWDWKGAGFDACPGATIVYDKPAPVYAPGQLREGSDLVTQREEIRRVVFEPGRSVRAARARNVLGRREGGPCQRHSRAADRPERRQLTDLPVSATHPPRPSHRWSRRQQPCISPHRREAGQASRGTARE